MTWIPKLITVTPALDTAIYAAGDTLFNTTEVDEALNKFADRCVLNSIFLLDEDAQSAANNAMDLYLLRSNVSFGALNVAPNISDANAREIDAKVSFVAADWSLVSGVAMAQKSNLWMNVRAIAGAKDLWIAGVVGAGAAPTHTASGLKIKLGLLLRP